MSRSAALAAALALASLAAPAPARAGEIEASLTTLISGRQDPRDDQVHTVVPVFELVSVLAADLTNPVFDDLRVIIGGWVRVDPGDPADDELGTGDINVAYVEGRLLDRRLRLRAGRQLAIGGTSRTLQYDGLSAGYRIWRGLSVEAYGGSPVTPRFVIDRGDAVAGTRLSWRQNADSEVGASFIYLRDDSLAARRDLGVDGRYRIARAWTATAYGLWSTLESRVAEVDVRVQWRPSRRARLDGAYRLVAPDLFLPRGSILAVFAQNRRQEVGASFWIRPRPRLRFDLESYLLALEEGTGARGRGRATLFVGDRFETRVGTEVRVLHIPFNGYQRARLYAAHTLGPALQIGADADLYHFEDAINGADWSLTGTANATYQVASRWRASVVGLAGSTPFLERRLEIMAKLTYGRVRAIRRELP